MRKTNKPIPVNYLEDNFNSGITIERMSLHDMPIFDIVAEAHRHDRHSFFLLENGTMTIEIDFQRHRLKRSSLLYMHPDQVHRILAFKDVVVSSWAITNEYLHPEHLKLLEKLTPGGPLPLRKETFSLFYQAVTLFLQFSEQPQDSVYQSLLKDSCNALIALTISQYLKRAKTTDHPTRAETVTQAFRELLDHHYTADKRPAAYARQLNLSVPYLNECVRNTTGFSVSHHIQQRVVLEAKRLLYHSDKSVKEIASWLGYDDYPYFIRLFTKVAGMPPLSFRHKNLD
ncbi:AraC family transcriptional regulator [Chitinophaga agri]|uniref:AraC family transcriptional regulator n=1 Tax=Chitinophaga agri TaxID=2703787 RepID=A0A6B9ZAK9_9BACT|nr:AraC family transcriptional regulator [Chitinophaga agri]QHS58344.1 AraC family transcriptional regulator [Chitinophaga agri]